VPMEGEIDSPPTCSTSPAYAISPFFPSLYKGLLRVLFPLCGHTAICWADVAQMAGGSLVPVPLFFCCC
jgi:hypothetical protein